jgi:hypothetical protein
MVVTVPEFPIVFVAECRVGATNSEHEMQTNREEVLAGGFRYSKASGSHDLGHDFQLVTA